MATVEFSDEVVRYPFVLLEQVRVFEETRDGRPIVVFWTPGAASALDARAIADSREVGATGIFYRELDGATLSFAPNPDDPDGTMFIDTTTGSVWDILGPCAAGLDGGTAAGRDRPRRSLLVRLGSVPAGHDRRDGLGRGTEGAGVRVGREGHAYGRWVHAQGSVRSQVTDAARRSTHGGAKTPRF